MKWINEMRQHPVIAENAEPCEKFAKLVESHRAGNSDFDNF